MALTKDVVPNPTQGPPIKKRRILHCPLAEKVQQKPDYVPLNDAKQEIRVLEISPGEEHHDLECILSHYSLAKLPYPYETISYCWGPKVPLQPITLNGDCRFITASAKRALRRIRLPDRPRVVWIDAVCIDQEAIGEKNHQVHLMSRIYSLASGNLIWLGEDPGIAMRSIAAVERMYLEFESEESTRADFWDTMIDFERGDLRTSNKSFILEHDFEAIFACFRLNLFTRLWVVQEIALSKSSLAHWGAVTIDMEKVIRAALWMNFKRCFVPKSPESGFQHVMRLFQFTLRFRASGVPLGLLLKNAMVYESTDLRDKVYAMLGMAARDQWMNRHEHLLAIDYNRHFPAILRDAMRYALLDGGELHYLYYVSPTYEQLECCSRREFPSWVVRSDVKVDETPEGFGNSVNNAAKGLDPPKLLHDTSLGANVLILEGLVADRIESTSIPCNLTIPIDLPSLFEWLFQMTAFHQGQLTTAQIARALLRSTTMGGIAASEFRASGLVSLLERLKLVWRKGLQAQEFHSLELLCHKYVDRENVDIWFRRRLFLTSHGRHAGLGPGVAQKGDFVAIIKGSTYPLLLRKVPEGYTFLGQACVDGIMDGEAVADLFSRPWTLTTFNIH